MNTGLSNQPKSQYKYLIFLAVFYFTGWAATYPLVYKIIYIDHIIESAAIMLFPICYAVADVIAEVYGYRIARQIVWTALICGFIFTLALQLVASIPAANFWPYNGSYEIVLGHVVRVYFSMTIASIAGNFINIFVISKFKVILNGRYFWARSLLSTGIGEFVFTLIGGTMVYAGVEPWSKIIFLMLDGYLFKMLYALIAVIPTVFLVSLLKRAEGVDIYDYHVNYNPFKFNTN